MFALRTNSCMACPSDAKVRTIVCTFARTCRPWSKQYSPTGAKPSGAGDAATCHRLGRRASRAASPETLEGTPAIDRWFIAVVALREHPSAFEHSLGKPYLLPSAELSSCRLDRLGRTFQ